MKRAQSTSFSNKKPRAGHSKIQKTSITTRKTLEISLSSFTAWKHTFEDQSEKYIELTESKDANMTLLYV